MASDRHCRETARRIRAIYRQETALSPEVRHFIESTYPDHDGAALKALLTEPSDSEAACLCDLICAPDMDMQCRLEEWLGGTDFHGRDVEKIVASLLERPLEMRLFIHGEDRPLVFFVPRSSVHGLVLQFNITRRIPGRLGQTIDRRLEQPVRTIVKVRIRNARFELSGRRVRFLCDLFEKIAAETEDFIGCVDLVLSVMDEDPHDGDMQQLLAEKKFALFKALQVHETQSERLRNHNIETLILQGVRLPHIDPERARQKMQWIDDICTALFGRTAYFERPSFSARCDGSAFG